MTDPLRTTTLKFDFDGAEGLQGIQHITRALSDEDDAIDKLQKTVAKGTKITVEKINVEKNELANARRLISQMERSKSKVRELTRFYETQKAALKGNSDQQEVLNSVYKLGAHATEKQKQEVTELIKEYQKVNNQVKETIKSEKELAATNSKLAAQTDQTKAKMAELTRHYAHQKLAVNQTADEQERLNAIYRLGAHATDVQKQQVSEMVSGYQRLRVESSKTQGSFRSFRGVTQNLGWQLQDVAVQWEHTNIFTIISQQGSQMASSFGKYGALVGAGIAVGGTAMAIFQKAMKDTKVDVNELEEAVKSLRGELSKEEGFDFESTDIFTLKTVQQVEKEINKLNVTLIKNAKNLGKLAKQKQLDNKYTKEGIHDKAAWTKAEEDATFITIKSEKSLKALVEVKRLMLIANGRSLKKTLADEKATETLVKAKEKEASQIGKTDRQISLLEAKKNQADTKSIVRLNAAWDQVEADEALVEMIKAEDKATKELIKTKEKADKAETKKREFDLSQLIKEEIIDTKENAKAKKLLAKELENVAKEERKGREFDLSQLVKEEIIDTREKAKAVREEASALRLRENIRKMIERGQNRQLKKDDPIAAEKALLQSNTLKLEAMEIANEKMVGEGKLEERKRINDLIIGEMLRSKSVMADINKDALSSEIENYSQITDYLGNAFGQLNGIAEEGSSKAKSLFFVNQGIAFASAIINANLAASKANTIDLTGITGARLKADGYMSAAIIAGQTIAGAYDKGGNVPSGKLGIVSEYGDELVNGLLVKGPARVTSREDTAKMMSSARVTVINNAPGVEMREERTSDNEIRIIAEKVFSNNIDSGVSGVLANRNSKSTKSMKRNFNVRSNF